MKTITAKEFNKRPAQAFREADKVGAIKINHDRYPDKIFFLESRDRRIKQEDATSAQDCR